MDLNPIIFAFSVVCSICVVSATVALVVMFKHNAEQAAIVTKAFFEGGNALRIATVLVIVGTAAVLALTNALSEGVLALMSAIAGYVLGGISKAKPE